MTQIVDDEDGEAVGDQQAHGVHTDEARAARDQDALHGPHSAFPGERSRDLREGE